MIIEAIDALKDKNGSSKRAILKYIELAHKQLPPNHYKLLTQHLKLLKSSGQVVMILLLLNVLNGSSAPKCGCGYPPKAKPTISATDFGFQPMKSRNSS
ncbi:hypothetical protein Golob_024147, partial [Gossypium lobatum]|nr:hypothetical protein [Gossypium lobatum]